MLRRRPRHRHPDPAGLRRRRPDVGACWGTSARSSGAGGRRGSSAAASRLASWRRSSCDHAGAAAGARLALGAAARARPLRADPARHAVRPRSRRGLRGARSDGDRAQLPLLPLRAGAGLVEGLECDEEALFAATMFHDYAFQTMDSLTDRCFTFAGAEARARSSRARRFRRTMRHDVLDAITLHINPGRPRARARSSTSPTTGSAPRRDRLAGLGARLGQGSDGVCGTRPRDGHRARRTREAARKRVQGCRAATLFRSRMPAYGSKSAREPSKGRWLRRQRPYMLRDRWT